MKGEIFEKNIKVLKNRFPEVAEYLERGDSDEASFEEEAGLKAGVTDVCGKTVMCAEKNGITYQLDSLYDSEALLDVWFRSFGEDWDFETKVFMYGLGNGMYARKFLKSTRDDCKLIIHEPSKVLLKAAMDHFDLTDVFSDSRVRIIFWPIYRSKEEIRIFYEEEIEYRDITSRRVAYYTNYPRLFEKDCYDYMLGIARATEYAATNQLVQDRFGGDYNRNVFFNLKYMPASLSYADLMTKMPEDIPAVIVAAGPSLDKNINELKAAKGKCLMISTDTALKPLALAGITPDLSAIMDGKKDARYLSEESSRKVPLFCTPRSGDTFMKLHTGVKFFTNYLCNHINSFMEREGVFFVPLSTGGSVANSCFALAQTLGCKRIILVGQDLAYTGDKTHSHVTVRGEKATAVEDLENVVMAVDINGDPIRSSLEFKYYKEWFEDEIRNHPELTVIDATEGGVRIEGTKLMTLKDAISKECRDDFDFSKVLDQVEKMLPGEKEQQFREFVTAIPEQMRKLRIMISETLADYRSMRKLVISDNYHNSQFKKLYRDSQIKSEHIENSPVIEYVHNQLQDRASKMLNVVNQLKNDEKSELLAVCDLGERYLQDMLDAADELKPYIEGMSKDFGLE